MAIKVKVQDSIYSDLFEVSFNDNLFNALVRYMRVVPTFIEENGELVERGQHYVMTHTNLIKVIEEMAL